MQRGSVALGSLTKIAQEKVSTRVDETDEGIGGVVGCPWVAQIREEKENEVDAAAATSKETQVGVGELFSGADGVGVHWEGLAWGNCPHGETRPRTQDGCAELARGQLQDMEWWTKPHAGWCSRREDGVVVTDVGSSNTGLRWVVKAVGVACSRRVTL